PPLALALLRSAAALSHDREPPTHVQHHTIGNVSTNTCVGTGRQGRKRRSYY
ncbi:unnamed protein product, partial [Ectocarpus sp. 6 AP-2014]